ncbi:hypothetical protein H920_01439 [Fukomys damarensis]|uniref:Uncharacterized protein n=1 Tax=Fukomys damarensis TaxID=885580 RepID=A0A091E3M0_FUKDA|nr:hypothetical protein H920_01439 [Fukomys damarensis]
MISPELIILSVLLLSGNEWGNLGSSQLSSVFLQVGAPPHVRPCSNSLSSYTSWKKELSWKEQAENFIQPSMSGKEDLRFFGNLLLKQEFSSCAHSSSVLGKADILLAGSNNSPSHDWSYEERESFRSLEGD